MADESLFQRMLLARGLLTPEQLEEAAKIQKTITDTGVKIEFEEVLLRKGYLTPQQLALVNAAIGKGRTDLVPGYEILTKIGQGGMGAVYKARQLSMDRLVAIKVLLPSFTNEKSTVERFLREAKVIAKLSHPNLVSGIDAGFQNGIYYCVMEYVEGQTLAQLMKGKPIPWKEALPVARHVALALQHAEQHRIVHRDVKPDNIIIDRSGTAKLMDLGVAKLVQGGGQQSVSLTNTGNLIGTPAYMSPEQATGNVEIDSRSDIYSLGLTLYEMLCGKKAFEGTTPMAVLSKRLNEKIRFEPLAAAGVPDAVIAVVRKMTLREREQRYQNAAQLLEDLDKAMAGQPVSAPIPRPTRALPPPRKTLAVPILIGAAVMLIGAGAYLLWPDSKPRKVDPAPIVKKPDPVQPKEKTPPPKPDPVVNLPTQEIEQYWNAALKYETEYQDHSPEDVLLNFIETKDKLRGTPRIGDIEAKITLWKGRVEALVKDEKSKLSGAIDGLLRDEKFGEAHRQLQAAQGRFFNGSLKTLMPEYASWEVTVKSLQDALSTRFDDRLRKLRDQAAERRKAKDFDGAVKAYEAIKALGIEPAATEAKAELLKLDEDRRAAEEARARQLEAESQNIRQHWQDACKAAAAHDYDAALQELKEGKAQVSLEESARWIGELTADMESVLLVSQKKPAPAKAQFLFALHEMDAAAAARLHDQVSSGLRPEYEELFQKVKTKAEEMRARMAKANEMYKDAEKKILNSKTKEEALRIYKDLQDNYKDALQKSMLTSIQRRLAAAAKNEVLIDAKDMAVGGRCRRTTHDQAPLKDVVVLDADREADPRSYVEFEFEAKAGTTYKLWLHMSYFDIHQNSVRVIFEGDAEVAGAIGDEQSERGYVIQYYPRNDEHGFGWVDRDMYASNGVERVINLDRSPGPVFRYKSSGVKKIRLATREPETMIDRALISSEKFVKAIPGASELLPKNPAK